MLCYVILYYILFYSIIFYYIVLYSILFYSIILYYIIYIEAIAHLGKCTVLSQRRRLAVSGFGGLRCQGLGFRV